MIGNVWRKLNKEDGAVSIIEATFVFPIMFIILFFLIYMGNAFYIKAQIESIAEKYAIEGSNHCADPILKSVESGGFPSVGSIDIQPYRYIFGGMGNVEGDIEGKISNDIEGSSTSFFTNMKPSIDTNDAKFNNYVVYSTFSVDIVCNVRFPIKFFGGEAPSLLTVRSHTVVPINDTAEFIRNTDMVIDYFHGTKVGQKISDVFAKINDFISSFAGK